MASPSRRVKGVLDTAETLQTFLAALNSIDKSCRNENLLIDLDGYESNLLQYLKLLNLAYENRGAAVKGFCRVVCRLMISWSSADMPKDLDEEELADAMFDGWKKPGPHPLVPEALTSALNPDFRITFLTAAEVLLGSTRPAMISSGLKLTKILTAMLAIQQYMQNRDTTEVLCVELQDVDPVNDLSGFDLPEGWEETLTRAANDEFARKASASSYCPAACTGAKRKRHSVSEPSGTGKPVYRCRRCDRGLASVSSLKAHLRWHCHGMKPQKEALTSVVPSNYSGSGQAESERKTTTDVVSRQEANDEEADQDPPADPPENESASGGRAENGSGSGGRAENGPGSGGRAENGPGSGGRAENGSGSGGRAEKGPGSGGSAEGQEDDLGDATFRFLVKAYERKMDKQLRAAARMVAKGNQ